MSFYWLCCSKKLLGNLLSAGIPLKCSRHSDSCFTISRISNRSHCSCLTVTNAPMNRFKWLISQSLFLYKQKIILGYTRSDKDKGTTCFEQAGIHCPQCQQEGILPSTQYPLRVHSVRRGIYWLYCWIMPTGVLLMHTSCEWPCPPRVRTGWLAFALHCHGQGGGLMQSN